MLKMETEPLERNIESLELLEKNKSQKQSNISKCFCLK
jgi:hypothetical protein